MVEYKMNQLLYLLVTLQMFYLSFSSKVNESSFMNEIGDDNFLPIKMSRSLTYNSKHGCMIRRCKLCSKDSSVCEICKEYYELKGQRCEKKSKDSNKEISLSGIIALVISLSIFLIAFCLL